MNSNSSVLLPILAIKPIESPLGQIHHILDIGGEQNIVNIEDIQISSRITEKLFYLENGEKIIITSRRKLVRPASVDGILLSENDNTRWLSHKKLEDFNDKIHNEGLESLREEIAASWENKFSFRSEKRDSDGNITDVGLRPPQIGSLYTIGGHWSLYHQAATVVMPTGTGKTETMLATLVAHSPGTVLIVVPSKVLRNQTAKKFLTLGLLKSLGNLDISVSNPIVGVINSRPKLEADLDIFNKCNVLIGTMSALTGGTADELGTKIAERVDTLIVDEAHHIGADKWSAFKELFAKKSVLQFTATPYRRDGRLVDGKVIYEYPLHSAQKDGYFKKISFEPVYEIDPDTGDRAIAAAAVERLKQDISAGFEHLIMARCENIDRARAIYKIYSEIASEFNPIIVHSQAADSAQDLDELRSLNSRIVVCVNMLGEGFDLPQLKIAAVHDTHKSLAVLLQFTGRFTRSSGANIGDATVIANIADVRVSSALERLYSEDANWNQLLSEFSSQASQTHAELVNFLNTSQRLDDDEDNEKIEISHHLLRPAFNTLTYEANSFSPKEFFKGLPNYLSVHRVWLHSESNTLYFVSQIKPLLKWSRSRDLHDRQWDLFILHFDPIQKLLFLSSTDKDSTHENLAKAVGGIRLIFGDSIFRSLGNINRLIFQNVGVKKHGRRNLRFALYTGSDVVEALSLSEKAGSVKSNLSGTGWENGEPVAIGCSYKGRVWTRGQGTIPEVVKWFKLVGKKLLDDSIDTSKIIANVLIPEEVETLPDKLPLSLEWSLEILRQSEDKVVLIKDEEEISISMLDIEITRYDPVSSQFDFHIYSEPKQTWVVLSMSVGGADGFKVIRTSAEPVSIRVGRLTVPIEEYFSNYPPLLRFIDLSELDGNLLIRPQNPQELEFPIERFEAWDWTGVDITKESIWKDGNQRTNSIQWKTAQHFINNGFEIVFDDDDAGEAADLVCFKNEPDHIRLVLLHCKFTTAATPGERVKDVVEVSSQAVRSAKWKWKFRDLCKHLNDREKQTLSSTGGRTTRFLEGQSSDLNKYLKLSRFKEIRPEILIVQPGLSQANITPDQTAVLASAYNYLKETIGVDLDIICSN